jgi:hypothetical protein
MPPSRTRIRCIEVDEKGEIAIACGLATSGD